jgi:ATP-dependent RNA helicase RhlB
MQEENVQGESTAGQDSLASEQDVASKPDESEEQTNAAQVDESKEAVGEVAHDSVEESTEEPAEASADEATQDSAGESAQQAPEEVALDEAAEAATEEASESTAEPEAGETAASHADSAPASSEGSTAEQAADHEASEQEGETATAEAPKVSFDTFDLQKPLRKAIDKLGFEHCTPIQAQSLVHTLQGHDVTGKAQTGTGKTAAFLITIINDLLSNPIKEKRYLAEPRALVVAPTRELAIQIASDADLLNKYSGLHTVTLVGGEDYQKQTRALDAKPVDIVVATPGRLLDFVSNGNLHLGMIELMVLDEADRMLDMGFIPQVRQIVARTPRKDCRQTLLFSATYTPEIVELSDRWAMNPIMVEVAPERVAADAVDQIVYLVTTADKYNLLYNLINEPSAERIMVFSNRRDQVRKLADNLHRNGISVGMLSGEVAQNQRIRTLDNFKDGKLRVLVATDVAGRGLHIDDVTHVINYTLPEEPEDYVHRIGRTGRAGAVGTSISFACEEDSFLLPDIEEQLGMKLECTHPDERLLERSPKFERESKFKSKEAPRSGGRSGGGGGRGGPNRR